MSDAIELQQELDELEAEIEQLRADIEELRDEVTDKDLAVQELEEDYAALKAEKNADYGLEVPPTDSDLYRCVWRPLYERWAQVTGGAYQPTLEELADWFIDESRLADESGVQREE